MDKIALKACDGLQMLVLVAHNETLVDRQYPAGS